MSKYDPFREYLFRKDGETSSFQLTFAEIEEIIGTELPQTARMDRPWWANTLRSNHARSWLTVGWKVDKVNLSEGSVTFRRIDGKEAALSVKASPEGGYKRFAEFLTSLPQEQRQLVLTFPEIEVILNRKLPNISTVDRPWWANTKSSPQGTSWTSAGWQVDQVFLKAQTIVFRRRGDNPVVSIPRYVRGLLESSAAIGHPDNRTLTAWIAFCRKIGWYFEGTVLFERGGLSLHSLDATERVDVEEHYDVCKRELTRYRR